MRSVYLNNQTASRPFSRVLEQTLAFQHEIWSAPHARQQLISNVLSKAEKSVAANLGLASYDHFIFAHSGEEAVHKLFLATYLDLVRETGRSHFLTAPAEISSTLSAVKRMEKLGCSVKTLPLNARGQITRSALEENLRARTALVSLSWAHPLTGVIQPIADLGEVCKQKGVLLHVDASAIIGKLFFRFQDLNVDFLTFDGSALHAPEGTAGLIVKAGCLLSALKESSEKPVAGIHSIALALEMLHESLDHVCIETARLRNKLEEGLKAQLPDIIPLFADSERVPHISALAFAGVHAEALLFHLQRHGIYATYNAESFATIMSACGLDSLLAHSALSFALSYETTDIEIDYAIEKIVLSVKKLRQGSQCLR